MSFRTITASECMLNTPKEDEYFFVDNLLEQHQLTAGLIYTAKKLQNEFFEARERRYMREATFLIVGTFLGFITAHLVMWH